MNLSQRFAVASVVFPLFYLGQAPSAPAIFPLSGARENQAYYLSLPQSQSALYSRLGNPHYNDSRSSWWVLEDGDYLRADRACWLCASFSQIHRESSQL